MRSAKRLANDAADGSHTATALRPTTETPVNPGGRANPLRLYGGADIALTQCITRTDYHGTVALLQAVSSPRRLAPSERRRHRWPPGRRRGMASGLPPTVRHLPPTQSKGGAELGQPLGDRVRSR